MVRSGRSDQGSLDPAGYSIPALFSALSASFNVINYLIGRPTIGGAIELLLRRTLVRQQFYSAVTFTGRGLQAMPLSCEEKNS